MAIRTQAGGDRPSGACRVPHPLLPLHAAHRIRPARDGGNSQQVGPCGGEARVQGRGLASSGCPLIRGNEARHEGQDCHDRTWAAGPRCQTSGKWARTRCARTGSQEMRRQRRLARATLTNDPADADADEPAGDQQAFAGTSGEENAAWGHDRFLVPVAAPRA